MKSSLLPAFPVGALGFSFVRRLVVAAVILSLCSVAAACGGGGGEADDGIGEIQFEDEPTLVPVVASGDGVDVIGEFLQETVLLLPDMEYLDTQSFYLGELQEVARDIAGHIEDGQDGEVGLEWVVAVHRTVLDWDAL